LCDDRCPASRRRADPPSLESRPSSRAGRFAGAAAVVAARAPLLCNCVVPLSRRAHAEFRLAVGTHTLSTPPSSEGPAFLGQELCEHRPSSCALPRSPSPCLCPWLCTCCWRCAIATAVPPTFTSTSQHRVEALSFLAEPVHARSRTREVVRRRMSPTNAAGPFLAVFLFSVPLPSARRQFRVAAIAEPSAIGTHTYACNRGAEPLLHLSVTVFDVPPCRRREPQRTGARVPVEPSTPSSNLSATSTLNTASPKSAR
jgi:hypothetical protein